jgi:hypothetical protein
MPADVASLRTYLGIDPASETDTDAMDAACAAANAMAEHWRPDATHDPETGDVLASWPPNIDQGALTYAARLYGRRGSVAGVAAFADLGVAMMPRLDPDVRALWQLGEYQQSVIA